MIEAPGEGDGARPGLDRAWAAQKWAECKHERGREDRTRGKLRQGSFKKKQLCTLNSPDRKSEG